MKCNLIEHGLGDYPHGAEGLIERRILSHSINSGDASPHGHGREIRSACFNAVQLVVTTPCVDLGFSSCGSSPESAREASPPCLRIKRSKKRKSARAARFAK